MEPALENQVIDTNIAISLEKEEVKEHDRFPHISSSEEEKIPEKPMQILQVNKEQLNHALTAEETIFGFSGLKVYDEINIFDVPIKFNFKKLLS